MSTRITHALLLAASKLPRLLYFMLGTKVDDVVRAARLYSLTMTLQASCCYLVAHGHPKMLIYSRTTITDTIVESVN